MPIDHREKPNKERFSYIYSHSLQDDDEKKNDRPLPKHERHLQGEKEILNPYTKASYSKEFIAKLERATSLGLFPFRNELLNAVKLHKISMITSPTGSGKSTQIPQYLLHAGYAEHTPILIVHPCPNMLANRLAFELELTRPTFIKVRSFEQDNRKKREKNKKAKSKTQIVIESPGSPSTPSKPNLTLQVDSILPESNRNLFSPNIKSAESSPSFKRDYSRLSFGDADGEPLDHEVESQDSQEEGEDYILYEEAFHHNPLEADLNIKTGKSAFTLKQLMNQSHLRIQPDLSVSMDTKKSPGCLIECMSLEYFVHMFIQYILDDDKNHPNPLDYHSIVIDQLEYMDTDRKSNGLFEILLHMIKHYPFPPLYKEHVEDETHFHPQFWNLKRFKSIHTHFIFCSNSPRISKEVERYFKDQETDPKRWFCHLDLISKQNDLPLDVFHAPDLDQLSFDELVMATIDVHFKNIHRLEQSIAIFCPNKQFCKLLKSKLEEMTHPKGIKENFASHIEDHTKASMYCMELDATTIEWFNPGPDKIYKYDFDISTVPNFRSYFENRKLAEKQQRLQNFIYTIYNHEPLIILGDQSYLARKVLLIVEPCPIVLPNHVQFIIDFGQHQNFVYNRPCASHQLTKHIISKQMAYERIFKLQLDRTKKKPTVLQKPFLENEPVKESWNKLRQTTTTVNPKSTNKQVFRLYAKYYHYKNMPDEHYPLIQRTPFLSKWLLLLLVYWSWQGKTSKTIMTTIHDNADMIYPFDVHQVEHAVTELHRFKCVDDESPHVTKLGIRCLLVPYVHHLRQCRMMVVSSRYHVVDEIFSIVSMLNFGGTALGRFLFDKQDGHKQSSKSRIQTPKLIQKKFLHAGSDMRTMWRVFCEFRKRVHRKIEFKHIPILTWCQDHFIDGYQLLEILYRADELIDYCKPLLYPFDEQEWGHLFQFYEDDTITLAILEGYFDQLAERKLPNHVPVPFIHHIAEAMTPEEVAELEKEDVSATSSRLMRLDNDYRTIQLPHLLVHLHRDTATYYDKPLLVAFHTIEQNPEPRTLEPVYELFLTTSIPSINWIKALFSYDSPEHPLFQAVDIKASHFIPSLDPPQDDLASYSSKRFDTLLLHFLEFDGYSVPEHPIKSVPIDRMERSRLRQIQIKEQYSENRAKIHRNKKKRSLEDVFLK